MIAEFKAALTVFNKGKELTHAATWKKRTVLVNVLVAFLSAAVVFAHGFGYDIAVSEHDLTELANGIGAGVAVFNAVMHVITSKKIGFGGGE